MNKAAKSSGLISSSAAVSATPAKLRAVTILTDGNNDATVIIYDAASATGTALAKGILPAADRTGHIAIPGPGVAASTGLWAELSGTGCNAIVLFEPGAAA